MEDTTFDFAELKVEEEEPEMTKAADTLVCVTCGTGIEYGGRGPKPKYCAKHKRNKSTPGTARKSRKKTGTDYREGIEGLLQLPAAGLMLAGMQTGKLELVADAATITNAAPSIAEALSDLANDQPQIAAVLDKVLKAGPYGALITAMVPMAMQLLTNHKVVPAGVMGTVEPGVVIQRMAEKEAQSAV
jgi:hypothetical protein